MDELKVPTETVRLVHEKDVPKSTVSSGFDYIQGASNSPYIITTSMVRDTRATATAAHPDLVS